jgi:hypothetical protein
VRLGRRRWGFGEFPIVELVGLSLRLCMLVACLRTPSRHRAPKNAGQHMFQTKLHRMDPRKGGVTRAALVNFSSYRCIISTAHATEYQTSMLFWTARLMQKEAGILRWWAIIFIVCDMERHLNGHHSLVQGRIRVHQLRGQSSVHGQAQQQQPSVPPRTVSSRW